MSKKAKKEYLAEIRKRYICSAKADQKQILDEFCAVCGYNRKYAIRLLNKPPDASSLPSKKAGRKSKYHKAAIISFLEKLLVAMNMVCSRRLRAAIPKWIEHSPVALCPDEKKLLMDISFSTIDRLLRKRRRHYRKFGLARTKPGSLLRKQIPVAKNQWDESRPGYVEADTVAHCGASARGQFVYSLQLVDIATGWTVCRAAWGKGERGIFQALQSIQKTLPFKIRGFDSDNGGEFLNYHMVKYFHEQKLRVQFTRSRPFEKNDNAHIEEKNWSHIRQYLGYHRFDNRVIVELLNDLYASEWDVLFNYFIPSMKLMQKVRDGATVRKIHDAAKTPFDRLAESGVLKKKQIREKREELKRINPFDVQRRMKMKILCIWDIALQREERQEGLACA